MKQSEGKDKMAMPKEEMVQGVPKWQAESDARTLEDACEIRGSPKRHKAAMSCMKQKMRKTQKGMAMLGDKKWSDEIE